MRITRLAVLGLAIVAAGVVTSSRVAAQAQGSERLSPQVIEQINLLIAEKRARNSVDLKIDSNLLAERRIRRGGASLPAALRSIGSGVESDPSGRIDVEVRATVDAALLQYLADRGIEVLSAQPRYDSVLVRATIDDVSAIAALQQVRSVHRRTPAITSRLTPELRVRTPFRSLIPDRRRELESRIAPLLARARSQQQITAAGPNTTQGDATHAAASARSTYGVNGAGVKIGVLSNGVATLAQSQSRGDLDAVTVLSGQAGSGDEGTAMLEIVHDLAPGASLYFATANPTPAQFAANIRALRTAGCDIIVDDVFYFVETPFQDGQVGTTNWNGGIIAQAVKDVVAAGALYFSSAGNEGNLSSGTSGTWEGDFVDAGDAASLGLGFSGRLHNFGAGQSYDVITVSAPYGLTLQWSDPLGGSANDYDLFVLNSAGTGVIGYSANTQSGTQDPFEYVGAGSANLRVVIVKYSGTSRFLHLTAVRGRLSIATAGEIHGHSATLSVGSFGVAATPAAAPWDFTRPSGPYPGVFNSVNRIEVFSSDGPRRIFYTSGGTAITPGNVSATGGVLANKPDITAADGVSTGVTGFTTFYGTSAAAPHVAAIAALVKSANPSLTVAEMTAILQSSAIDIEAAGFDRDSGAGIVMANTAVQAALGAQSAAALMSPNRVDPITTSSVRFSWMAMSGALQYALYVGSTAGASDISAQYTTGQALTATGIPINEQLF